MRITLAGGDESEDKAGDKEKKEKDKHKDKDANDEAKEKSKKEEKEKKKEKAEKSGSKNLPRVFFFACMRKLFKNFNRPIKNRVPLCKRVPQFE